MNVPIAKYTETLLEFNINNPTFLEDTLVMSTTEKSQKLINAVIAMYNVYEIGSETEDLFKLNFADVFALWKDYYEEKITAYEKAYDYSTGNRRTYSRENTIDTSGEKDSSDSSDNKHTEIELPNKKVDTSYEGYPNDISKDDSSSEGHTDYTSKTEMLDLSTTTYHDEFIDLKNKYIKQIKSMYNEFASKFKECFMLIY